MNKAFEKIRERLQKQAKIYQESLEGQHSIDYRWIEEEGLQATEEAINIINQVEAEYNNGWIPVKTRPMTEEEKEYYSEYLFEGNGLIYECPLPDDGQEVLITSKYGSVDKTTFYTDCGNYFENYEDYDEVIAWRPLPQPYKEGE